MTVMITGYSEEWPVMFELEACTLREHLRPWLTGGVHHIGSTAVAGLAAKPILDMMAGVHDLGAARAAVPVLAHLGYRHADHRPHEALWFYKQQGDDYAGRTHQLHLTQVGSALWRERLAFRDALRADSGLRHEYQALKQSLASGVEELAAYTQGKREFVVRVLRAHGIELG
jgi:GrpB-like predicted nucleotidyltransferase (UPF0157 family)